MISRKSFALLLALTLIASGARAQTTQPTLTFGSDAPPLKIAKWLRGEPVEKFQTGHVYVIEFWATWCGPCKAAMPHLSELAKKHEGKITFIGVDVWEQDGMTMSQIEEFVAGPVGQSMQYSVAADEIGRQGTMALTWLKAAGQNGIPATFVVDQNGKIAWMGHPNDLEPVLPRVLDGTWNIAAERSAYETREAENARISNVIRTATAREKARDWAGVIVILDTAGKLPDRPQEWADRARFHALLHIDESKACELAQKIRVGPNKVQMQRMFGLIMAKSGSQEGATLSQKTYALGAEMMDAAFAAGPNFATNYEFDECRAALYFGVGDAAKAAAAVQNALDQATKSGRNQEVLARLSASLKKYQSAADSSSTTGPS